MQQRQKPIHLPAYRLKSLNELGTLQFEPTSSLVCTHALKSPDHVTAVAVFSSRPWSSWAAEAGRPAGITLGARALLISCLLAGSIDDSARRRLERSLSFPPVRPNINFPAKMFFLPTDSGLWVSVSPQDGAVCHLPFATTVCHWILSNRNWERLSSGNDKAAESIVVYYSSILETFYFRLPFPLPVIFSRHFRFLWSSDGHFWCRFSLYRHSISPAATAHRLPVSSSGLRLLSTD